MAWDGHDDKLLTDLHVFPRVLVVSNIPAAIATCQALFNLFGLYGDVAKIKITRKNASVALVEFYTATMAAIARRNLHGVQTSESGNFKTVKVSPLCFGLCELTSFFPKSHSN